MEKEGEEAENDKLQVRNVKAHFGVTPLIEVPQSLQQYIKTHNNFWIFRPPPSLLPASLLTANCNLVYIVFPKSGHVNVSGIKSFSECYLTEETFVNLFQVSIVRSIVADNSTVIGQLLPQQQPSKLNLGKLITLVPSLLLQSSSYIYPCTVSIRPHYFPSALIRPKRQSRSHISTVILFTNGKYIIIGSKDLTQAKRTLHNLEQIVYNHNIVVSDSSSEEE